MKPLLHPATGDRIHAMLADLAGSYIFAGPAQTGKQTTSIWIAKKFNCQQTGDDNCPVCRQIETGNFPDLITVAPEGNSIGIAQIQQLQDILKLQPYNQPAQRIVVIDQAQKLTDEAQNCLLKTLEEPPTDTVIFLLTTDLQHLLPTVKSRCQLINFIPPKPSQIEQYLVKSHKISSAEAKAAVEASNGQVGMAVMHTSDPNLREGVQETAKLAKTALGAGLFERLLLASKLATTPDELSNFVAELSRQVKQRLSKDSALKSAEQLEAIEKFYRYQAANVNIKASLEALMLEL